jgi:hypothetical protein
MESLQKFDSFVSSVGGIDRAFRLLVYSLKIVSSKSSEENSKRFSRLINSVSDARIVMRFFGTISMINSIPKVPLGESIEERIIQTQTLSMLIYYPTELIYYLSTNKILFLNLDSGKWSRISCRAWAVYCFLDLLSLLIEVKPLMEKYLKHEGKKGGDDDKKWKEFKSKRFDYLLRFLTICGDLPLSVHWSLESYPLSEFWVGVFGFLSAVSSTLIKLNIS